MDILLIHLKYAGSMQKIALQGICFDEKSSYQKGARLAPPLIRQALHSGSGNLFAENGADIGAAPIEDKGDYTIQEYFDIEGITRKNLEAGHKVLTLGGDHSITFPIVKAFHHFYPRLDILHIDAHADLYDHYEGDPYSHACPFARIMEGGLALRLVQIGIRTLNPHQAAQAKRFSVEIHEMKDLDLNRLPRFEHPLYLSLDMDGFDPAFAPGVSHHEPGGLSTREVIRIIQGLEGEVVGADIVEYNPERDFQGMTAFLAAKMMKEILAKMLKH